MDSALFPDAEFHRRRAEVEMEKALAAREPDAAIRHLELARIHREQRALLAQAWRDMAVGDRPAISRTDKEA